VTLWLCVAPLRLGGLRGKKSTPSVWLGGTGEFLRSASRSRSGTERADNVWSRKKGNGMLFLRRIDCINLMLKSEIDCNQS
jgi:hypothetical protein